MEFNFLIIWNFKIHVEDIILFIKTNSCISPTDATVKHSITLHAQETVILANQLI